MKEIRLGDIVHLNSGSPELTVTGLDGGDAEVEWFDGKVVLRHTFPIVCLTPLKRETERTQ